MADDFKQSFSPDTGMLNAIIDEVHRGSAGQDSIGLDENLQDASEDDETPDAAEAAEDDGELKINLPPRGQRRKKATAAPRGQLPGGGLCRGGEKRREPGRAVGQNRRCFCTGLGVKGVSSWWRVTRTSRVFSSVWPLDLVTVKKVRAIL